MDRIGLSLEQFGPDGRFRTEDEHQNPIDPSGEIEGLGRFEDHRALGRLLGESPQYRRCLATKLMTYATGRELTEGDRCHVESIVESTDGNTRFSELLVRVVASDSFLNEGGTP